MPPRSALARLQQIATVAVLLAAATWAWSWWPRSPGVAIAGAVVILSGHGLVLFAEFVVLARIARTDTVPPPTTAELAHAWWAEFRQVLRVFCWRQPFRWRAEPDHLGPHVYGRTGVVFVHGFVCNRGFWSPWMRRLRGEGRPFVAVNLEPVFTSIDNYVAILDEAVSRLTHATGMPPVLVCHSMGGLAARAWLRQPGAAERVGHVVTLGSPHHGAWIARLSHVPNGRQMRSSGAWLQQLERDEARVARRPPFTCWHSNCDNIVFPTSSATLPGADNRLVRGAAHVDLAFRAEVMDATLALIGRL